MIATATSLALAWALCAPSGSFDEQGLIESLTQPDHVARESSFVAVVETAKRDPALHAWLCARASDPAPTELSWTCRLAVREIALTGGGGPAPTSLLGQPVDRAQDQAWWMVLQKLEADLRNLWAAPSAPGQDLGWNQVESFWWIGTPATINPRPLRAVFEALPRGKGIRLQITEEQEGERVARNYEARDLGELLEQHPELERQLIALRANWPWEGLQARGTAPAPVAEPDASRLGVYVAAAKGPSTDAVQEPQGLVVYGVVPGGLGQLLGLVRGDLLRELNGVALGVPEDISRALLLREPGTDIVAKWRTRSGEEKKSSWRAETEVPVGKD